jgi:lambda family phage portal protein
MAPNILERAIGAVAPGIALKRAEARRSLRRMEAGSRGGYEGASKGRRTAKWMASGADANAALSSALPLLRARSRDLVRNNPWAGNGVGVIEAWVIGTGITGQPVGRDMAAARLREKWSEWAGSTACDVDDDLDFAGLQAQVVRCMVESGSCLIRRRTRRESDGLPVPLQLQLIEPDQLDLSRISGAGTNEVIHGVEYDAIGKRVAYWLFPDHPGSDRPRARATTSQRIPASEILHVFRPQRVGQVQGAPWLTGAIQRMRMLDEFEDGQLLRMVIAASWSVLITRAADPETDDDDDEEPIEEIQPGAVEYLNPGESVTTPDLPAVTGIDAFTAWQLRGIAAALEIPYELLTGDLTKVNFSSGRMGFNAFERRVAMWQARFRRQFLDRVRVWFVEAAIAAGVPPQAATVPWAWTPPARMILDPDKEGQAEFAAVRNGTKTLSEVLRGHGKEPRAHLEEAAADFELLDELELVLDCDPRKVAAPGAGQVAGKDDEAEPKDEDADGVDADADEDAA